jgi:hypothetical protein
MLTHALRFQPPARTRVYQSEEFRKRALDRLYERKAVVEALIVSLERYERATPPQRKRTQSFSEMPKCS